MYLSDVGRLKDLSHAREEVPLTYTSQDLVVMQLATYELGIIAMLPKRESLPVMTVVAVTERVLVRRALGGVTCRFGLKRKVLG